MIFQTFVAVQTYVNLVDLEKRCKIQMRILSLSEASIQPRTSLSQFGGASIQFFNLVPRTPVTKRRPTEGQGITALRESSNTPTHSARLGSAPSTPHTSTARCETRRESRRDTSKYSRMGPGPRIPKNILFLSIANEHAKEHSSNI